MNVEKQYCRYRVLLMALGVIILFVCSQNVYGELPVPVVLRHIDLSGYAGGNDFYRGNMQFGDLNNDGVYTDFIRYANSKRMQAFAYSGGTGVTLLWDYTAPVSVPDPPTDYHYKYVIWDIDNDNQSEVIGPFASSSGYVELRILDGATGNVENSITTTMPNPTSSDNIMEWRIYVTVANFRGLSYARDIVLLNEYDSYGDIWVYDDNLNLLWDTTGDDTDFIYAHFPYTGDIDGDGKDELVARWIFDDDGTRGVFLSDPTFKEYLQHLDRGFIGELDTTRSSPSSDVELMVCHEQMRAKLYDGDGNLYWENPGGNSAKIVAIGEFSDTLDGQETVYFDSGGCKILDIDGNIVKSIKKRVYDGYQFDYDGDRAIDEAFGPDNCGIIFSPWGDQRILLVSYVEWFTGPVGGQLIFGHSLDIVDDYREDIVIADEDEIIIMGHPGTAPGSFQSPWTDDEYKLMIANRHDDIHPEKMWFDWRKFGTGPPPVAISGLVRESDLTPIEGVDVDADSGGGSDTTDQTGYYEVSVPDSWSGTVTPTKTGWTFEPVDRSYSNVTSDQTDQNYTGTYVGAPEIYVHDIGMSSYSPKSGYYAAKATVWIKDTELTNIVGATVYGDWSGATVKGDGEMTTGEDGKATLESDAVKGGGTFTFTVTDVTATGYTYNSTLNNETSDSITVP